MSGATQSDARTRTHSQSLRETRRGSWEFCTKYWPRESFRSWSAMRPRIAFRPINDVLGADAPECERGLGLDYFAIHLQQWINEKINRAARRLRINHQITAFR